MCRVVRCENKRYSIPFMYCVIKTSYICPVPQRFSIQELCMYLYAAKDAEMQPDMTKCKSSLVTTYENTCVHR